MLITGDGEETEPSGGNAKEYVVVCDDCSFDRHAEGRHQATRLTIQHKDETGHEVLALESPPNAHRHLA